MAFGSKHVYYALSKGTNFYISFAFLIQEIAEQNRTSVRRQKRTLIPIGKGRDIVVVVRPRVSGITHESNDQQFVFALVQIGGVVVDQDRYSFAFTHAILGPFAPFQRVRIHVFDRIKYERKMRV